MRVIKIILLSLLGLITVLGIGGYLYFKKAFTPPPNYLELTTSSGFVPIQWSGSKYSDYAVLFLPVTFEGIPDTFYMQFDTGAPSTKLYKQTMLGIMDKYPDQIAAIDSASLTIDHTFQLGDMRVHSPQFELYDRGKRDINWNGSSRVSIGTLGADIIDKKLTVMDFKNHRCFFGEESPDLGQKIIFHELIYTMRKVLMPAVVAGKKRKLLHDSGTSGFDLITNKESWKRLSKPGAKPKEAFKVNSWKRQLTAFNIASDKKIDFKPLSINLNQVTYIEGASFVQHASMRMTGMGGMIGNQLFMGKVLVLDCKGRKYGILE